MRKGWGVGVPHWAEAWREPRTELFEYTWKDAVLYALGIGAQGDEMPFLYEGTPGGLRVFPSFAAIAGASLIRDFVHQHDAPRLLHGEQGIRLHGPLPPQGKVVVQGRITDVFDKGKAAVIHFRSQGGTVDGAPLFEVEHVAFYLGAGGFGGDPGPPTEPLEPPEGVEPRWRVAYAVPSNQAALYRLSGDLNPLHIDSEAARRVGFPRPILHGLCTYGFATRAIVHGPCRGDAGRLREFKARFSNAVFPGETLVTEGWEGEGGRTLIRVRTERAVVITNAYAVMG
jgi:acyl dehydratase